MEWGSAEIDSDSLALFPLVQDALDVLKLLVEDVAWASEWLPKLRIGSNCGLAEKLNWRKF